MLQQKHTRRMGLRALTELEADINLKVWFYQRSLEKEPLEDRFLCHFKEKQL